MKAQRKCYLVTLFTILVASVYPLYMGISTWILYMKQGFVDAASYPKYIIPYTPVCLSLILVVALLPLLNKRCKRFTLLAASGLGVALFVFFEACMEQIKVATPFFTESVPLDAWQLSLCRTLTPEEIRAYAAIPQYAENNVAFKIHFYIIAILIVLSVLSVAYRFYNMYLTNSFRNQKPVKAQLLSVAVFIGLCIWACFTAFYRTGELHISPLSAVLMSVFFIIFGLTAGIYTGCFFFRKKPLFSVVLPALVSAFITFVMYMGELILLDGTLYRFGNGPFFEGIGKLIFAPADILVILLSGAICCGVTKLLNHGETHAENAASE